MSQRLNKIQSAYQGDKKEIAKAQTSPLKKETVKQGYTDDSPVANRAKFLYNEVLDGVGNIAAGLGDFGAQMASLPNAGMPFQVSSGSQEEVQNRVSNAGETLRKYREEIAPEVRGFLKDKIGSEEAQKFENNYRNETFTGALGGLARTAPAIAATVASGGLGTGALFLQSYDSALQSIDQSEAGRNLDDATKTIYATGIGIVSSALEKVGLDKIMKGETGVISKILADRALKNAVKETGEKVTGDAFTKFLNKEIVDFSGKFAKGGAKVIDGYLTEYATGATQEGANIAGENILNSATGKPVFDMSDTNTWSGFLKRVNQAGNAEGIGGGFLGTVSALGGFKRGDVQAKEQQIRDIDATLANEAVSDVAKEVLVQNKIKLQSEVQEVADKIDETFEKLDDKQKQQVSDITENKIKIEEAISDPNITPEVKTTLEQQAETLDKELSEIKPVEQAKPKTATEYFDVYKDAVDKSKTVDEAYTEVTKDGKVLSDTFVRKYNPDGSLSQEETFAKFYNEIKPSKEVVAETEVITPTEEVKAVEEVKPIENENIQSLPKDNETVKKVNPKKTDLYLPNINLNGKAYEHKSFEEGRSMFQLEDRGNGGYNLYTIDKNNPNFVGANRSTDILPLFNEKTPYNMKGELKKIDTVKPAVVKIEDGKLKLVSKGEIVYDDNYEYANRKTETKPAVPKTENVEKVEVPVKEEAKQVEEAKVNTEPKGTANVRNQEDAGTSEKTDEKVKPQILNEAEQARRLELRNKFKGRFNDITNIVATVADKEFREYAGLILKEAKGEFKAWSNEMVDSVGEKIREYLPKLYKDLGGKEDVETKTEPKAEPKQSTSKDFDDLATRSLPKRETRETKSNVEAETGDVLSKEMKEFEGVDFKQSLIHGDNVVQSSKTEFGDTYVTDLLNYVKEAKMAFETKAVILVSLENDLRKQLSENPTDTRLRKQVDAVTKASIEHLRSGATAAAVGQFRWAARENYETQLASQSIFSPKEREQRSKVESAVASTPEEIQKEYEQSLDEEFGDVILEKPTGAKLKKAQEQLKQAKDDFRKAIRRSMGQMNATGAFNILGDATKLIKAYAKVGIVKIEDVLKEMATDFGEKFVKNNEQTLRDAHAEASKKKFTPEELLQQAKDRIRESIEEKKENIANRKAELKSVDKRFEQDAEYRELERQLRELEKTEREFLSEADKGKLDERRKASIIKKLENEIADLDEQIAKGERKAKDANKDPLTNDAINDLKASKKAKMNVLMQIDPDTSKSLKQALIEAGYGKEITVTVNEKDADGNDVVDGNGKKVKVKEQRNVLDWKKLLGIEGSFDNMRDALDKSLKDKGYSQSMIDAFQQQLENEYNDIHADIIDKSLNELNRRNTPKDSNTKTLARRLAELYNLGLYEKNVDEYSNIFNNLLGVNKMSQDAFNEIRDFNRALARLLETKDANGNNLSDVALATAETQVKNHIKKVVDKVQFAEGNMFYKASVVLKNIFSAMQRMMLVKISQLIENPFSGALNDAQVRLQDAFKKGKWDTKELAQHRKDLSRAMYADVTAFRGDEYGGVGNPFTSKNSIEDFVNGILDKSNSNALKTAYNVLTASLSGRLYLDAADSFFKIKRTEKEFTHNLIRILTDRSNPNGAMSQEDALQYVSEALTGQSFTEAKKLARNIIKDTNDNFGREILRDTESNVIRLANDIVKDNLVNGEAITQSQVEDAFKAGYKTAGKSIGHESNNYITDVVNKTNEVLQTKLNEALKKKDWSTAAVLNLTSILSKNIINPFVGGGTNWTVIGLQKMGFPTELIRSDVGFTKKPIDLSTREGLKELDKVLSANATRNRMYGRMATGTLTALAGLLAVMASGADDEYLKWLRKHKEMRKLINKIQPTWLTIYLARDNKNGEFLKGIFEALGSRQNFDEMKVKRTADEFYKGMADDNPQAMKKAWGGVGELVGRKFSVPYFGTLPNYDATADKLYKEFVGTPIPKDTPSRGFFRGFYKDGMVDFLGLRPEDTNYEKDMAENKLEDRIKELNYTDKLHSETKYVLTKEQARERRVLVDEYIARYGDRLMSTYIRKYTGRGWKLSEAEAVKKAKVDVLSKALSKSKEEMEKRYKIAGSDRLSLKEKDGE